MKLLRGAMTAALVALWLGASGGACGRRSAPPRPIPPMDHVPREAREFFQQRCASCHGEDGSGNGPAAAGLTPRPRDFGDRAWQRGITDARLRETIVRGGAAVGKSPMMPPAPDLEARPRVLDGLVAMVRAFGR